MIRRPLCFRGETETPLEREGVFDVPYLNRDAIFRSPENLNHIKTIEKIRVLSLAQIRSSRSIQRMSLVFANCRHRTPKTFLTAGLDLNKRENIANTRDNVDLIMLVGPHVPSEN